MTAATHAPDSLWSRQARQLTTFCGVVGLTLLGTGLAGAEAQNSLQAQTPWLNAAVLGSITAGIGQAAWLVHGRRSLSLLRSSALSDRASRAQRTSSAGIAQREQGLVVLAGSGWSHSPSCLLVVGKPTETPPSTSALVPCPVCRA